MNIFLLYRNVIEKQIMRDVLLKKIVFLKYLIIALTLIFFLKFTVGLY